MSRALDGDTDEAVDCWRGSVTSVVTTGDGLEIVAVLAVDTVVMLTPPMPLCLMKMACVPCRAGELAAKLLTEMTKLQSVNKTM